jgi:hypothetical protein
MNTYDEKSSRAFHLRCSNGETVEFGLSDLFFESAGNGHSGGAYFGMADRRLAQLP